MAGCAAWTTAQLSDDLTHVLFTEDQLQDRIVELAADIDRDYEGKQLPSSACSRARSCSCRTSPGLEIDCRMDFMGLSSYGSGTKSSGVVRIPNDLKTDISGVHVLVVEDIIDTGLTMPYLIGT